MTVVQHQLSSKPVSADLEVVAEFLNRELVPVVRRLRQVANESDHEARITALEAIAADLEARVAALEAAPFESDFGDGVSTTFDFAHPFGTYAVVATIWDNATRQRQPLATESTPDVNTYRVVVASPPTASQYHIAIARMRG